MRRRPRPPVPMTPTRMRSFAPRIRPAESADAAATRRKLLLSPSLGSWFLKSAFLLQPLDRRRLNRPGFVLALLVFFRKSIRREECFPLKDARIGLHAELRDVVHKDLAASLPQRLHVDGAHHEPFRGVGML